MYPLCPYHAAWKPGSLVGVAFGGAIPGPTSGAHAACVPVAPGNSEARTSTIGARTRTVRQTHPGGGRCANERERARAPRAVRQPPRAIAPLLRPDSRLARD